MKKFFCFSLIIAACMQIHAQDVTTAKWLPQPVVIDGNANEWGELNLYDDDTKLSFAIANDSNNIYLCFENSDQTNQMKMMRAGMKVNLSTKGRNKHDATIEFPLPQSKQTQPGQGLQDGEDSGKESSSPHIHNANSFRNNYISNHAMMNVSGFTDVNGMVSTSNTPGLKAAIGWDSASNLFYEIAIAKKEFYGADYSTSNSTSDITLNVEINAVRGADAENRSASSGSGAHHWQTGGGGAGGGGGMHGGGMHGGRQFNNNGEGGNQNQNFQSQRGALGVKSSFKQKFVLNNNKTES